MLLLSINNIFVTLTDFTLERERYCLPDSRFVLVYKSRNFVPGYSRFARYCLPDRACCFSCLVVWLSCCLVDWYCLPDSSSILVFTPETSSRVTLAALGIGFQPNLPTNNKTTIQLNDKTTNLSGRQYRAQRE